jgi:AmmeMemoRadiSam system protein B
LRQDAGYLYILRTDAVRTPATAAYRVTFTPEGNRDVYVDCEDGLRIACGVFALRGALEWARRADLAVGLLDLRTSADTAGDPSRVVGYGAFALTRGPGAR